MVNLKNKLSDWTDCDIAESILAIFLGIIPNTDSSFSNYKWLFCSDNEIGDFLYSQLEQMASLGILLKRDEPDFQYKWNPNFDVKNIITK